MSDCGYDCHQVGGPWIAENPDCPVHGGVGGLANERPMSDRLTEAVERYRDALEDEAYDDACITEAVSVTCAVMEITPILRELCEEIDRLEAENAALRERFSESWTKQGEE